MPVKYDKKRVLRPGENYPWTNEMVKEYALCAKSVKHFALSQCKVTHPVDGLMSLQLRSYQMRMLECLDDNRLAIMNCPRQVGKSTIVGLYCLWYAMFSTNEEPKEIWILANKGRTAQSLLSDIKDTYEELEPYIKAGIVEYNKTAIEFENGSSIKTGTTSRDTIRGESVSFLVLDEFAHVPPHIADDFYTGILPTISTGGKLCVISTPNGNNGKFYELFSEAKDDHDSEFKHFDMKWNEPPGRDEEFKRNQIKNSSLQEWNQEFEAKFLGSSRTLIDPDALEHLGKIHQIPNFSYENFDVWEKAKEKRLYILSCDVAKGVQKDSSVIQVLDVTNSELAKQVAVWYSNSIDPFDFAEQIVKIAKMYNNAYVVVENNTYGHEVCRRIHDDLEYDYLYKERKTKAWGVCSSSKTKAIGTSVLKRYIENSKVLVRDEGTFDELCSFVEVNPDIYKAASGKNTHDDRVMALVWGVYFLESDFWKEWSQYMRNEVNGDDGIIDGEDIEDLEEIFEPIVDRMYSGDYFDGSDGIFDDSWLTD